MTAGPHAPPPGRERALAARVQTALERVYQLERIADVADFLQQADAGEREALFVREADDGAIEVRLRLPRLEGGDDDLDTCCQVIEGVSHFVYVVERARTGRETTRLELEVQAEVDKWLVLAASLRPFDVRRSAALRQKLYERVCFADTGATERGERYRVANDAAHAFVRRLEARYVGAERYGEMRSELRQFFHGGQEEKLRLGRAA